MGRWHIYLVLRPLDKSSCLIPPTNSCSRAALLIPGDTSVTMRDSMHSRPTFPATDLPQTNLLCLVVHSLQKIWGERISDSLSKSNLQSRTDGGDWKYYQR